MKYDPPIEKRSIDELIEIAHFDHFWQEDASMKAKKELENRGITLKEQRQKLEYWKAESIKEQRRERSRRKNEGYTYLSLIVMVFKWPFAMLSDWHLKSEGYLKMHKQRLIAITTGVILYLSFILHAYYSYDEHQTEWMNEVNNTDISEWEREHLSEEEYRLSKAKEIDSVISSVESHPFIQVYLDSVKLDNSNIEQLRTLDFSNVLNVAFIKDIDTKELILIRIKTDNPSKI